MSMHSMTRLRSWMASSTVLKPVPTSARPGDRERAGHRPDRDDDVLVGDLVGVALERLHGRRLARVVEAVTRPVTISAPREHPTQGHDHVARLDGAGGRLGQERLVGHVRLRVDDRDDASSRRSFLSSRIAVYMPT